MIESSIYYRSAQDARDAGELDAYRSSNAENRRTRDVIDAAISAHFDGCRLPLEALQDVLQQADPDRVALVLAATMDERQHDGRFASDNRSWAAGIRRPDGERDAIDGGRCDEIHPGWTSLPFLDRMDVWTQARKDLGLSYFEIDTGRIRSARQEV